MKSNLSQFILLHTNIFVGALLPIKNTQDPDQGLSPSEIVFIGQHATG